MTERQKFKLVGAWFFLSIFLPLLHDGFNRDMATRMLLMIFFGLSIRWYLRHRDSLHYTNPKRTFVTWATINAAVVEIFHMISKPLDMSLLITTHSSFSEIIHNTLIDLILTTPAYIFIFLVMLRIMQKYSYSVFAFFFLMSLGQALGDGSKFFLGNVVALIFAPWAMLNYWSMNFVPFLAVRSSLPVLPQPTTRRERLKKIFIPLVFLPGAYIIAGFTIIAIGKMIGWLP